VNIHGINQDIIMYFKQNIIKQTYSWKVSCYTSWWRKKNVCVRLFQIE